MAEERSPRLAVVVPLRAADPLRALADADLVTLVRAHLVRRQGSTVEPRLSYETRTADASWTGEAHVAAVFGDSRINRYFYEVGSQYATAARPAYQADSGRMLVRAGLAGSHRLNPDVRLFGFVRYDSYDGAANSASPLMQRDHGVSAGFGFAWTFMRSAARAQL